jgi:exodeoxyribonuclease VII large subunit
MAVPVRSELLLDVGSLARRALACWRRNQEARRTELRAAARALPEADEVLALPRQRLDHAAAALARGLRANAHIHHLGFLRIGGRLGVQLLRVNVERRRERFSGIEQRLRASLAANVAAARTRVTRQNERIAVLGGRAERAMGVVLDRRADRLERASQLLLAFSYRGVLERGFALVRDAAGRPVRAAKSVSTGMRLDIEFSDGRVGAVAGDARVTPQAQAAPLFRRRRRRSSDGGEGQGSLF